MHVKSVLALISSLLWSKKTATFQPWEGCNSVGSGATDSCLVSLHFPHLQGRKIPKYKINFHAKSWSLGFRCQNLGHLQKNPFDLLNAQHSLPLFLFPFPFFSLSSCLPIFKMRSLRPQSWKILCFSSMGVGVGPDVGAPPCTALSGPRSKWGNCVHIAHTRERKNAPSFSCSMSNKGQILHCFPPAGMRWGRWKGSVPHTHTGQEASRSYKACSWAALAVCKLPVLWRGAVLTAGYHLLQTS